MTKLDRILERYDVQTLESALVRRRRREKGLVQLAARRRKLEAELEKLLAGTGERMPGRAGAGRRGRGKALARKPNARRLNKITLAEALERVLKARKGPTHYKDLTDTVTKRKIYRTKSKNLLSTVVVTLKRDSRFKKVKPGVYALR